MWQPVRLESTYMKFWLHAQPWSFRSWPPVMEGEYLGSHKYGPDGLDALTSPVLSLLLPQQVKMLGWNSELWVLIVAT